MTYSLSGNPAKIHNAAPGVIFYYSRVTALSASFSIDITQTNNSSNGTPFFSVQQGNQVTLYNSNCTNSNLGTITVSGGQVHIAITGATVGQVFVIGVKYSTKSVVGAPAPIPVTVHYDFVTYRNGSPVATDPLGLNLQM